MVMLVTMMVIMLVLTTNCDSNCDNIDDNYGDKSGIDVGGGNNDTLSDNIVMAIKVWSKIHACEMLFLKQNKFWELFFLILQISIKVFRN